MRKWLFAMAGLALFSAPAFTQSSEEFILLKARSTKVGADCTGGARYDDGTFESGYKFNSFVVSTGSYVMAFDLPAGANGVTSVCTCWLRDVTVSDPTSAIAFAVNVWAADGPGGSPGSLLGQGVGNAQSVGGLPKFYRTELNIPVSGNRVWIGPQWSPGAASFFFLCADQNGPLVQPAFRSESTAVPSQNVSTVFPNYRTLGIRAEFSLAPVPTAPAAPSGLSAQAVSSSEIVLNWQDNSTNEDAFRVEQIIGSSFLEIGTVASGVATVRVNGLSPSTPYAFRVRASNGAGNSPYSNTADATTQAASLPPPPPAGTWLTNSQLPGFQFKVRISGGSLGTQVADCVPETLCVAGAIPTRSELFLRIIGPRPNGFLWAQVIRFTTSRLETWVQRTSGGPIRYYDLPSVPQDSAVLSGLVDKEAFQP